ncbi:interleukin-6 receptor subunit beta-like isoform X1 [Dicentrarchus labrax]|uniref:Fibronectin type-III domain-containing protein n=2 Tax=Dicentrarchus labrax TaxID=13489 RepID=A0A8P4KHJ8_DICLA|nr:interleukin-6 receptor subunit beta-like isoform X1 [Dicentrarchus labrax]
MVSAKEVQLLVLSCLIFALPSTGDPLGKPQNLSCIAVQEGERISPNISCVWETAGRQTTDVNTTYTLNVGFLSGMYNVSTPEKSATVSVGLFPNPSLLDIWVEAHNTLGKVESEHLKEEANWFVKTNPPSDVRVISERTFPTSLLINWAHPIEEVYVKLTYEIRFCPSGSQNWTYVPLVDTAKGIQCLRLQNLQPDTVYDTQVRCKSALEGGYWSNWSTNATERTPEDRPRSKPDLWKIITVDESTARQVWFICKDPVLSNGRIIRFDIKIQDHMDRVKKRSGELESIPVNRSKADPSPSQQKITILKQISLDDKKSVEVYVTAVNSVGKSPEASLVITEKANELPTVKDLKVQRNGGQLCLEWKPPARPVSEYVVEWVSGSPIDWVSGSQMDWQREQASTTNTVIKGSLEKFVSYTVSVYPLYSGVTGKPASKEAFLEEGVPLKGPAVKLKGKPGCNEAELVWNEIPQHSRRGFITNYTIFYTSGTKTHNITVPANTTSYTLKSLSRSTKYDTWVIASTIRGSKRGFNHSFTTLKYGTGEIEGIVVGVCLSFLFVVLLTMLLCINKKDVIEDNFWPRIPNPGESTIGNWSPDYPLKTETPKENCLSGISVLDVDVCDGKCWPEDDKASLPLKKDKYLSEEHSSGIGGSSCMSSPCQSVSDSDEGGDMADTTASTIQTLSSQPQQDIFSRSESTQPLLDSEENPDMLLQEGSRQSQHFSRQPSFTHTAGNEDSADPADFNQLEMEQQVLEPLDFCPLEEETTPTDGQSADGLPAALVSSYMPQLGGYRPQ